MMTIENIRKQFPYLKSGKIYLNHAAISPLPLCVKEKMDDYLKIRTESEIEPYFETLTEANGAKEKLAIQLNVHSKNIAWAANVSNSLNILAQGLKWNYGDEIILNDIEFPSNVYPFLNLTKQGVNVVFAKNEGGAVDIPQIKKKITRKTKLVSISMVQFLTGYKADLKSLGDLCKKNSIILCVDGIQGFGAVNINLNECNIDFFAGGTHKWLMALQGLGYFYISQKLMEQIDQKQIGWTSVKNPWNLLDYDLTLNESASRFENGTLPRLAIVALNSSLNFFSEVGHREIEKKILDNSIFLRNSLKEIGLNLSYSNGQNSHLAGIISFNHEDSKVIADKLISKNIICSSREGVVRISPHFYNSKSELELLTDEIKRIVKI